MSTHDHGDDVADKNVETLLETGGEPPRLADISRARIRAQLIAKHGREARTPARGRWIGVGAALAVAAAAALIVTRFVGGGTPGTPPAAVATALADGTTWIADAGGTVTPLGARHVRVEGAVLLDVAPGKGTFVVETARGRIEVLGTRFLVDAEPDRTTAAVVRGLVKLATADGDVTLHAGEQGVAEPGHPPTRGPAPRLSHLVSWAAQARRRAETDLAPIHHGTLFARDPGIRSHPPWGEEYPLPIAKLGVDVVVEDRVARVALDQTFHNNADQTLEGVYRFAIPPDAALQRLAMYVDGKLTESAVVERMRARRIYEELVYRRIDPALLEWAGTGRLALRVYPLPAHQDKRLMLAYTQSLPALYDAWTLAVPLPEIDQPVGEVAVHVTVKDCARCELSSTSHQITVAKQGADAVVTYQARGVTIGDSLVLHVRDPRHAVTVARHTQGGGDSYLMVRAPADLERTATAYRPRTWVILDDVSASRDALARRAQADMIDAFMRELDEQDRVSVIAFDVTARQKLAPTRVLDVDRKALRAALKDEGDVGATDFGAALAAAGTALAGVAPDDAMIVYLGDGVITSGPRHLDELRAQLAGKAHFVGVGVGDGPDTQTLEALAAATGGFATTIDLADDVGWRTFDLVAALHTARVTGIEARLVDAQGAAVPATLYLRSPQLADGEELELVAKLAGGAAPVAVELTGTLHGAPWTRRIALAATPTDGGYLPRLWAQHHIAARMLAKHEAVAVPPCSGRGKACPTEAEVRETRDEAIRREVVALGKQYFLLSRHTSLLVLENDAMYAQYGVTKGAGDTWAPYAMPAKIPVVATPTARPPSDVADDAELVRAPLEVFYDGGDVDGRFEWQAGEGAVAGFGVLGTIGAGSGFGYGVGFGRGGGGSVRTLATRSTAGFGGESGGAVAEHVTVPVVPPSGVSGPPAASDADLKGDRQEPRERRAFVDADEVLGHAGKKAAAAFDDGIGGGGRHARWAAQGPLNPQRLGYPGDEAFDDVTAFVPALVRDGTDAWRARLLAAAGPGEAKPHAIEPAAAQLLAQARAALPAGTYRWGELEIAVDAARRIGWRRTTGMGLAETASFDGATWTRRYPELGLDVTRVLADDDVGLALSYLPVWIAEPAHYARWFDVRAQGPHSVALVAHGKPAYVLELDDHHHLVAIRDGAGTPLVEVTWGAQGPTAATVHGDALAVGFTAQPIADAVAWAHGASSPGVVVTLPAHLPAYWQDRLAKETAGSPAWRQVQRQRLVAFAALGDRGALFETYEALRTHGGVELGDVALASGGLATGAPEARVAPALAAAPDAPLVRYLVAGRAFARSPSPERLAPGSTTGLVGGLWQLRQITAYLRVGKGTAAVDRLVAMGDHALELRLIAAALVTNRYELTPADLGRAWDAVAVGIYRNVARAQAAQAMANRGAYDAAADRVATLVADLDLAALPPRLENLMYYLQRSRRGPAGWQLIWTTWRDKVLASSSFEHVLALVPVAAQQPGDLPAVLARAGQLAAGDVDRTLTVARLAAERGQLGFAQTLVEPLLKTHATREVHQLAAGLAFGQGRPAEALTQLEAAQAAAGDEPVSLAEIRAEMTRLIGVARQLAVQSSGAARTAAVERAMTWGARWRAIDAGNSDIDQQLGELQLAVGDRDEAWRQLSTVIERDPMQGRGYAIVAEAFERQGRVAEALPFWQDAIVLDQTDPTPRLRKAQALIALGKLAEGDALLAEIVNRRWHDAWSDVVYRARDLLAQGRRGAR